MLSTRVWTLALLLNASTVWGLRKMVSVRQVEGQSGEEQTSKPNVMEALKNVLLRSCVQGLAGKFQAEAANEGVKGDRASLQDNLKRLWEAENNATLTFGLKTEWLNELTGHGEELAAIKNATVDIETNGFSPTAALDVCHELVTLPPEALLHQCVDDLAQKPDRKDIRKWSWLFVDEDKLTPFQRAERFSRGVDEKSKSTKFYEHLYQTITEMNITKLLEMRWETEGTILLLDTIATDDFQKDPIVESVVTLALGKLKMLKIAFWKAYGLSFSRMQKACTKELRASGKTPEQMLDLVERATQEMIDPAYTSHGVCTEVSGQVCPEGFSPQFQRRVAEKAATTWLTLQIPGMGAQEITVGLFATAGAINPALVGTTAGLIGVELTATTAWAGALAMAGLPYLAPFALVTLYTATAMSAVTEAAFPKCRCHPQEWHFDPKLNTCILNPLSPSANAYGWLPYPGETIAPVFNATDGVTKCEQVPCSIEDFAGETGVPNLYGSAGYKNSSVYNCLSRDGSYAHALMTDEVLSMLPKEFDVDGEFTHPPNTALNRQRVYDLLEKAHALGTSKEHWTHYDIDRLGKACSEKAISDLKARGYAISKFKGNSHFYLKCAGSNETKTQKASCLADDCVSGGSWCFVPNGCGSWFRSCQEISEGLVCNSQ